MKFRTDLAIERREYHKKETLDGVLSQSETVDGVKITRIEIINEQGERLIGKPEGRYITLEADGLYKSSQVLSAVSDILCREIRSMLPSKGTVLVAGLGNDDITPDALGPESVKHIFSTRHISAELAEDLGLGGLRSVACLMPGVLGKTGVETVEIIGGVAEKISPCCVIVIDALASRKVARLGTTVQLCDTGVAPGSGVGNRRKGINAETLGVPVIAVGVPTVVDALTMARDVLEKAGVTLPDDDFGDEKQMMVTPKEIDSLIDKASKLVAMGINLALQESLTAEDLAELVG